jgi:hypothetical protein
MMDKRSRAPKACSIRTSAASSLVWRRAAASGPVVILMDKLEKPSESSASEWLSALGVG